MEENTE